MQILLVASETAIPVNTMLRSPQAGRGMIAPAVAKITESL